MNANKKLELIKEVLKEARKLKKETANDIEFMPVDYSDSVEDDDVIW